jgi:hypothetical protein
MEKDEILSALQSGGLHLEGQFIYGSNYTFMAACQFRGNTFKTVYKPVRGERPLWDFTHQTLARREVAAFLLSEALGWELVPPTVFRQKDAPMGAGSLQLFIEHDPDLHYFNLNQEYKYLLPNVMLFDLLINNADRKGGHLLINPEGKLFLIDHGLSFHVEDKLRTVVWDHAGEPIPSQLLDDVNKAIAMLSPGEKLYNGLKRHLMGEEITALLNRAQGLLMTKAFPLPPEDRRAYPWPLV